MASNNAINAPIPFAIAQGGTASTSVTTAPAATAWAGWDANKNFSAAGVITGYSTTATAAGTTTLTVASNQQQYFTGSTTQTLVMPVANTLVVGQNWSIVNNSTGVVTIQSSGGNTILALPGNSETIVTCVTASGTSAASWVTSPAVSGSGTVNSGTLGQLAYYAAAGTAVSGGGVGNVKGTTTNDSAAAGYCEEFVSARVTSAGYAHWSNSVITDLTTISLTAGDWDVWGNLYVNYTVSGTTTYGWISTTSATLPDSADYSASTVVAGVVSFCVPAIRLSLSGTTTVYLSGFAAFVSGSTNVAGGIYARRRR